MQLQISSNMQPCEGSPGVVSMHAHQHSLLVGTNVPIGRSSCLMDVLTAVDWNKGMHHTVSDGFCWAAIASLNVCEACSPAIHAGSYRYIV